MRCGWGEYGWGGVSVDWVGWGVRVGWDEVWVGCAWDVSCEGV